MHVYSVVRNLSTKNKTLLTRLAHVWLLKTCMHIFLKLACNPSTFCKEVHWFYELLVYQILLKTDYKRAALRTWGNFLIQRTKIQRKPDNFHEHMYISEINCWFSLNFILYVKLHNRNFGNPEKYYWAKYEYKNNNEYFSVIQKASPFPHYTINLVEIDLVALAAPMK